MVEPGLAHADVHMLLVEMLHTHVHTPSQPILAWYHTGVSVITVGLTRPLFGCGFVHPVVLLQQSTHGP
jgi:hypothetical protein